MNWSLYLLVGRHVITVTVISATQLSLVFVWEAGKRQENYEKVM